MNRVQRAIIMAAGLGKRMNPVTFDTPKPMIEVNGRRMIDTVIDALHENGINEVYVVVGYLKEKFEPLKEKYRDVKIIENPYYETCNNISSLYVAREYLENAIILDGDQIIYNKAILNPNFELSGYSAIWVDDKTDEWLMNVDENEIITSCSRTGGERGWQLFSISRWNSDDAKKLKKYLEYEFVENNNTQIYWDDVAMFCHFDDFKLGIYKISREDIIEIDDFKELCQIDSSYNDYNSDNTRRKK